MKPACIFESDHCLVTFNVRGRVCWFKVDYADLPEVIKHSWYVRSSLRYPVTKIGGRHITIQSFLLGRPEAGKTWDHINRDPTDNRRSNLRLATISQNAGNQESRGGTSRFKGVSRRKNGRWLAQITARRQHRRLGLFDSEQAAAAAYNEAALQAFGPFACLNSLQ